MGSKGHARTLRKQSAKSGPHGRKGLAQARDHRKGKRDPQTGLRPKVKKMSKTEKDIKRSRGKGG